LAHESDESMCKPSNLKEVTLVHSYMLRVARVLSKIYRQRTKNIRFGQNSPMVEGIIFIIQNNVTCAPLCRGGTGTGGSVIDSVCV